ncbi:MAG: hypothetical protein CMF69_10720 [Magnetovibrio sp.]|nr:hypothetical protein [Magnetovibrio sp.]
MAEQHGVTFAAGLACEGYKPFCAIYSTFLQRAYDQVVHDVAIQQLPVRFAIDRAGYVGADGSTHCGAFDLPYLCTLPGFIVMAPSNEAELMHMTATAVSIDDSPCAIRYPRGEGSGIELPSRGIPLEIGKGQILREGTTVAILGLGSRVSAALQAAEELSSLGFSTTVADARFAKPLDESLIKQLAQGHEVLLSIEEGSVGGFGAHVMHFLANAGFFDTGLKFRALAMPDRFLEQDSPDTQNDLAGLTARHIIASVLSLLGREDKALAALKAHSA